jgi:hypothetical protein
VSFGYLERVAARDLDWALEEGAKQWNGFEGIAAKIVAVQIGRSEYNGTSTLL